MKRIAATVLSLSLLTSAGLAFAEPPHHDDRHDHKNSHSHKKTPPGHAKKHWEHGQHLPNDHRGVYVEDYHRHGLREPPRGHQWRRVDDQYVLIAVATGVIASVILANH